MKLQPAYLQNMPETFYFVIAADIERIKSSKSLLLFLLWSR